MAKARSSSNVRHAAAPLALAEGERVHVGVDVHESTYSVAIYSGDRGLLSTWAQPADPEVLLARLRPIRGRVAEVAYEAGPAGFSLARRLGAEGFAALVVAPSQPLTPAGPEAKSDRIDCRRLAWMSQKGLPRPVHVPTEQQEADRQVMRLRERFVRKARTVQQRIKSLLLVHGIADPPGLAFWRKAGIEALRRLELGEELRFCLDVLLGELEHARKQVARITERLEQLAAADRHREAVAALRTVPGVGPVTAMTFRLELPEPGRFDHAGQVAKMLGLAPQVRQSGPTRREGGLLRGGNARLRAALVESAWRWVARDESASIRYRRLVANTGSGKKAVVGTARRLGVLLWRLSTRGQPYRAAA